MKVAGKEWGNRIIKEKVVMPTIYNAVAMYLLLFKYTSVVLTYLIGTFSVLTHSESHTFNFLNYPEY